MAPTLGDQDYFGRARTHDTVYVRGPEEAIWAQTQGDMKAWVYRVNDKYDFEVYDVANGAMLLLTKGTADTLPLAKEWVFKFFEAVVKGEVIDYGVPVADKVMNVLAELSLTDATVRIAYDAIRQGVPADTAIGALILSLVRQKEGMLKKIEEVLLQVGV